jgi:putative flippase GtrA
VHSLVREAPLFLTIGVVNTVIDYAVLNALLVIGPLKAKVISTVVATTASYFMNRHWTYAHRESGRMRREYVVFFCLNLAGLAINLSALAAAKYVLDYSEHNPSDRLAFNIANAVGIGLAMVFRFFTYRLLVFRAPAEALHAAESAVADGLLPVDATAAGTTLRPAPQPASRDAAPVNPMPDAPLRPAGAAASHHAAAATGR